MSGQKVERLKEDITLVMAQDQKTWNAKLKQLISKDYKDHSCMETKSVMKSISLQKH